MQKNEQYMTSFIYTEVELERLAGELVKVQASLGLENLPMLEELLIATGG